MREDRFGLTFETLLRDPLIRLVMESDGVSDTDMIEALEHARHAVACRERAEVARRCL